MSMNNQHKYKNTPIFKGFTTFNRLVPPYEINDIDCVKQDLVNALHTKKGSRVMMPEFGTRIYDLLFDPFDEITRTAIYEDVEKVINDDPRVEYLGANAIIMDYGLRLEIELLYTPENARDTLYVDFIKNIREEK